ncbi:MAG: hypothetical protein FWK01_30735 [Pantanalinema sp. GBBB05]|nr:hypothetical protein [Pantanalinema sp. GBBB05]
MLPILPPETATVVVASTPLVNHLPVTPTIDAPNSLVPETSRSWFDSETVNSIPEVPRNPGLLSDSPSPREPTVESAAILESSTVPLPSEPPADLAVEQPDEYFPHWSDSISYPDLPATPPIAVAPEPTITSEPMPQFSTADLAQANSVMDTTSEIASITPEPVAEIDHGAMDQVTSVSQLADVQPTDWAFTALQSLAERYGCIAGYPDHRFRGNQSITRYEFAAGLNACLNRVEDTIATTTDRDVRQADLLTFQRLQEEFSGELGQFADE